MSGKLFQKALRRFAVDAASGGAIRHLADLGHTARQIYGELDYPVPLEKISEIMYSHFVETGVIREKEPVPGRRYKEVTYIREYDRYGRSSIIQKVRETEAEERAYVKCDFGKRRYRDPEGFSAWLDTLSEEDRDYIEGIPWPLFPVWHEADERMRRITENQ